MKNYLNPLLHPEEDHWYRYVYTLLCIGAFGWNIYLAVRSAMDGSAWAFLSFVSSFLIVGIWSWVMSVWRSGDARICEIRQRRDAYHETRADDDSIAVVPSSEATDPYVYALMRAMESEDDKGVAIYQDEFGVWRDSDTDEPLPVQESKREEDES